MFLHVASLSRFSKPESRSRERERKMGIRRDGGEQSSAWVKKQRAMAGMTLEVFLSMDGESLEEELQSPLDGESPRRMMMVMEDDDVEGGADDRRHLRMMKNRESAARSRARKQAYIRELENKISRLEEENGRLKKQREMEEMMNNMPLPKTKVQLRRTSSCPL